MKSFIKTDFMVSDLKLLCTLKSRQMNYKGTRCSTIYWAKEKEATTIIIGLSDNCFYTYFRLLDVYTYSDY